MSDLDVEALRLNDSSRRELEHHRQCLGLGRVDSQRRELL
jgi:hypothetical protein